MHLTASSLLISNKFCPARPGLGRVGVSSAVRILYSTSAVMLARGGGVGSGTRDICGPQECDLGSSRAPPPKLMYVKLPMHL